MSRHKPHRRISESHLPRPHLIQWSTTESRQRVILDAHDLEQEMAEEDIQGWSRLVVIRADCDVVAALGRRGKGWWWEFPEMMRREEDGEGDVGGIRICRASVFVKSRLYFLLLDGLSTHHRSRSSLESTLWTSLPSTLNHLDLISQVIHKLWLETLSSLPPLESSPVDMQHVISRSLETNADATRAMERRGEVACVTAADWTRLAERIDRRMQLSVVLGMSARLQEANEETKDKNGRRLDRIAYLGGLLLPITVVSGILSIEGMYGPEGTAFWVFWLAAGLSSLVALLVIYADHARTLEVWTEVAAAADILGVGDEERGEAKYTVQEARGRTWKRKELGWVGALKKMSGWYWWRGSPGLEFRMPGVEVKVRGFSR